MQICHVCDNRLCVNPTHLFIGSHKDNMADMRVKKRSACGIRNSQAKLSPKEVEAIRQDKRLGRIIAAEYRISEGHVSELKHVQYWK